MEDTALVPDFLAMEAAAEEPRSLVVSLHDVSPRTWESCDRILAELRKLGVRSVSLLVIPDHHHRGHFLQDQAFCEWLREQVASGHEAVIHGYYHQRPAKAGETWRERFITRSYTAGEGEFFDLSYDAAKELVTRARKEFVEAHLRPCGFIAPAWLLSEEAETALVDLGFAYTTRLRGISDFRRGEVIWSQSLCWSVRAAWRRAVSIVWNAFLFHRLELTPVMRVAIHPVDLAHPQIWGQIQRLIRAALITRQVQTYEDLLSA